MTIIKIDRSTVKLMKPIVEKGIKSVKFEGVAIDYSGNGNLSKFKWKELQNPVITSINIEQPIQIHEPSSSSPYSFGYIPTMVTCINCKSTFLHTYLTIDGDYDWYAKDICPVCGESECCDYEFERLTESQLSKIATQNKKKVKKCRQKQ